MHFSKTLLNSETWHKTVWGSMELQKVSRIHQKYKDIVFGFIKRAQRMLPKNSTYFNIVPLIQHIILLYYHQIFESNMLNDTEREKMFDLLESSNKEIVDYPWKLIFHSEKDGKRQTSFIEKVFDHPNVILFMKLNKECVIGG